MPFVAPFIPDRFASAVDHYRRHRLRYPARLIEDVAGTLVPAGQARVLDLGCGPGFLAIEWAKLGHRVLGLDPDPAMVAAAEQEAASAGVTATFRVGSSYDLSPALGTFDLVVMGRSFHWMDRTATLGILEAMIPDHGAIVLFGDAHEKTAENRWREILRSTREEFVAADAFSHRRQRDANWQGHVALLLNSAFTDVQHRGFWERRSLGLAEIIGRALSMSGTAPGALGERREAFEAALAERIAPLAEDGLFTEVVEFYAVVARRSRA